MTPSPLSAALNQPHKRAEADTTYPDDPEWDETLVARVSRGTSTCAGAACRCSIP